MTRAGMMQRHIRDLNCQTGGKFPTFLAKRAQNNRVIDPSNVEKACVFQVSVQTRKHFLVLAHILRCEWSPERARWSLLPAGETTHRIPQEEFFRRQRKKSFIDQVCLVKMAGYCPRSLFASLWNSTQSEYSLFKPKTELLYFKPIQLQKLASKLSIGNRRISSNGRAPAQHARGTNDKAKTFVQLTATTTLVSLVPEGDAPSKSGADNAMVVSSTLTRTTKIYFYFFVASIKKHFKADVRCFSDYT